MYLKKLLIFLICLFVTESIFSQNLWLNDMHQVQLKGKYYNTFDEISTFNSGDKSSGSMGVGYKFRVSENQYLGTEVYKYVFTNRLPLNQGAQGIITRREFTGGGLKIFC